MEVLTLNVANGQIELDVLNGKNVYKQGLLDSFKPYTGVLTITGSDADARPSRIMVISGEHHLLLTDLVLSKSTGSLKVYPRATCKIKIQGDVNINDVVCLYPKGLLKVVKGSQGRLIINEIHADAGLEIVYPNSKKES